MIGSRPTLPATQPSDVTPCRLAPAFSGAPGNGKSLPSMPVDRAVGSERPPGLRRARWRPVVAASIAAALSWGVISHSPVVRAQAPSISDPRVLDQLRHRLYRVLNGKPDKAKVQAPKRTVLRVTRKRAATSGKGGKDNASKDASGNSKRVDDPLLPLVRAALARAPQIPLIEPCPTHAADPRSRLVPTAPPVAAGHQTRLTLPDRFREVNPCPPTNVGPMALAPPVKWSYHGKGAPSRWGHLRVDYATCIIGERQSPVMLDGAIPISLHKLATNYRSSRFHVIDDGRAVVVSLDGASTLVIDGKRYRLKRIRFHRPGEHVADGIRADMSAHLIHEDAQGRTVAVAVPLQVKPRFAPRSPGNDHDGELSLVEAGRVDEKAQKTVPSIDHANPALQRVLDNLPLDPGSTRRGEGRFDPRLLLPASQDRYVYEGSLTTPPCTEGVRWHVMRNALTISQAQYAVFEKLFPESARPLQALNGRRVKSTM